MVESCRRQGTVTSCRRIYRRPAPRHRCHLLHHRHHHHPRHPRHHHHPHPHRPHSPCSRRRQRRLSQTLRAWKPIVIKSKQFN